MRSSLQFRVLLAVISRLTLLKDKAHPISTVESRPSWRRVKGRNELQKVKQSKISRLPFSFLYLRDAVWLGGVAAHGVFNTLEQLQFTQSNTAVLPLRPHDNGLPMHKIKLACRATTSHNSCCWGRQSRRIHKWVLSFIRSVLIVVPAAHYGKVMRYHCRQLRTQKREVNVTFFPKVTYTIFSPNRQTLSTFSHPSAICFWVNGPLTRACKDKRWRTRNEDPVTYSTGQNS